MMDFKDMLLDAIKQGTSLEDVMKGISEAATQVEKEQKAAAAKHDKYLKYSKPLGEVYNTVVLEGNIFYREKLATEDVALILAHYVCQNLPGYAEFAADEEIDLIKAYAAVVETQLSVAKSMLRHKDDGENAKVNAMADALSDLLFDAIFSDAPSNGKAKSAAQSPSPFATRPRGVTKSDEEKIAAFMKNHGL